MASIRSWEVSDAFWERVRQLIPVLPKRNVDKEYKRNAQSERKPMKHRKVFEGIVQVLRVEGFTERTFWQCKFDHAYFLQQLREGFFLQLWRAGLVEYDEPEGIAWEWQSIDGARVKAPLAGEAVGPNPTDRGSVMRW